MATDLQSPFVAAQGLFRVPQFVEVLRYCSYPMVANLIVFVMKNDSKTNGRHLIFRPYVVRNGKVIYPKNGGMLAFWVEDQSQSSICRRQLQLPPFYFCSYNSQDFLRSPTLICFFLQQKRNFFISFFLYITFKCHILFFLPSPCCQGEGDQFTQLQLPNLPQIHQIRKEPKNLLFHLD